MGWNIYDKIFPRALVGGDIRIAGSSTAQPKLFISKLTKSLNLSITSFFPRGIWKNCTFDSVKWNWFYETIFLIELFALYLGKYYSKVSGKLKSFWNVELNLMLPRINQVCFESYLDQNLKKLRKAANLINT